MTKPRTYKPIEDRFGISRSGHDLFMAATYLHADEIELLEKMAIWLTHQEGRQVTRAEVLRRGWRMYFDAERQAYIKTNGRRG